MFSITTWKTKVVRSFIVFLSQNDKQNRETDTACAGQKGRRGQEGAVLFSFKIQQINVFASSPSWVLEAPSVFKETEQQAFLAIGTLFDATSCNTFELATIYS